MNRKTFERFIKEILDDYPVQIMSDTDINNCVKCYITPCIQYYNIYTIDISGLLEIYEQNNKRIENEIIRNNK